MKSLIKDNQKKRIPYKKIFVILIIIVFGLNIFSLFLLTINTIQLKYNINIESTSDKFEYMYVPVPIIPHNYDKLIGNVILTDKGQCYNITQNHFNIKSKLNNIPLIYKFPNEYYEFQVDNIKNNTLWFYAKVNNSLKIKISIVFSQADINFGEKTIYYFEGDLINGWNLIHLRKQIINKDGYFGFFIILFDIIIDISVILFYKNKFKNK